MSPRLPRITAKDLVGALKRDGWYEIRQTGSHVIFQHDQKAGNVVVPVHSGRVLKLGLLSSLLDDAALSPEELRRLL